MHHAKRERQLLEITNHPYIVKLHYAFQTHDKLYFVLDWVNGGELYFHLRREKIFPENRVRLYVAELGLVMHHLHSLRVIYRYATPAGGWFPLVGFLSLNPPGVLFCGGCICV